MPSAALTGTVSTVPDRDVVRRDKESAECCLGQHGERSVNRDIVSCAASTGLQLLRRARPEHQDPVDERLASAP